MRWYQSRLASGVAAFLVGVGLFACGTATEDRAGAPDDDVGTVAMQSYPTMTTEAEFLNAMEELSNWGRWGVDDELGAANLITPDKRRAAAALVHEGISVSLAHDIVQEEAIDAGSILSREVLRVSPSGASDRLQYTGSYHGVIHSHLDALDCHIMVDGKGYNGVSMEEIEEAGGCPRGSINALKDGIITRGVLFDATLLPGFGTPEGWVEPGTAIRAARPTGCPALHEGKSQPRQRRRPQDLPRHGGGPHHPLGPDRRPSRSGRRLHIETKAGIRRSIALSPHGGRSLPLPPVEISGPSMADPLCVVGSAACDTAGDPTGGRFPFASTAA